MAELLFPHIRVPHPHVRVDASVLAGSPHVIGSRVPVRRLWAWHRGGASVETLVRRYPNLGPARILDALSFAYDNQDLIEADLEREQSLFAQQGGPGVGARPEGVTSSRPAARREQGARDADNVPAEEGR